MCDCKHDGLWVRFQLEEMKYLFKFIFSFLRSGGEVKRGVEFRYSTCNASRIRRKVENEALTKFPLSNLVYTGYSVKLTFFCKGEIFVCCVVLTIYKTTFVDVLPGRKLCDQFSLHLCIRKCRVSNCSRDLDAFQDRAGTILSTLKLLYDIISYIT